ncbi:(2Fe-2S)-binding protein [Labilithrix luteola]|nr:(2Fe-2S)-binding protein [Labilithrix luteola]
MYVCVCLAVTEQEVEAAIAGGAHTRTSVTAACRAGGDCGACHQMIEDMVEDHLEACAPPCEQSGPIPTGPQLVAAEALVRTRAA